MQFQNTALAEHIVENKLTHRFVLSKQYSVFI